MRDADMNALCCRAVQRVLHQRALTNTCSMQDVTHATLLAHLQKADLHANDPLCAVYIPPAPALPSDSIEHHRWLYFSPNGADKAGEPPQSYLSSASAPHKEFFSRAT